MSTKSRRRRSSQTQDIGSAGRESGGRPKGIVSGGLVPSPFTRVAHELPASEWADAFDWYSFICASCASETHISRELSQTLEDFALMCSWLYGDPPVCSYCAQAERGMA